MGAGNDPGTDDAYEDDRVDERRSFGWLGRGLSIGYGWPPVSRRRDTDETAPGDERYDAADEAEGGDVVPEGEDGGSWWDEALISILLVAGVVLFIFPEPATSMLGIVLIAVGVVAWLIDAFT
ncbi:hypothetical protein HUG10_05725 [Halorarum halophilum]|uniref:Uncharacterized protein n=1 Tax=Halorarum halophilum TaxID=2743090 RepID=A0A7D5KD96_9EURY|nr:hypothetical protein [Halobaculum halophilum]QLG26016.1 hypothetical protein HUG10_05725 [Halobaculum halophilum]